MTSAKLRALLLTTSELGAGYSEVPADSGNSHDNIGMQGCAALSKFDSLDENSFAASAVRAFEYNGDTSSELQEDLHSDSPWRLSSVLGGIVQALISCHTYTMTVGETPVQVVVSKSDVPHLGDEQFGVLITLQGPARTAVIEDDIVRIGAVAVDLSGAPGLVRNHLRQAVLKVRRNS